MSFKSETRAKERKQFGRMILLIGQLILVQQQMVSHEYQMSVMAAIKALEQISRMGILFEKKARFWCLFASTETVLFAATLN